MGDQNKILDVTYGKFSCRLEGFDDAVETMKAVVTYFHDLAGHENFLEIAPGMPDLETLAKMAEAQSGGSVTAVPMGDGVSLTRTVADDEADAAEEAYADLTEVSDDHYHEDATAAEDTSASETSEDAPHVGEDLVAHEDAVDEFSAPTEYAFETPSDASGVWEDSETDAALDTEDADEAEEEAGFAMTGEGDAVEASSAEGDFTYEDSAETDVTYEGSTDPEELEDDVEPDDMQQTGAATGSEVEASEESEEDDEEESFTSKLDRIRAVVSRGVNSARPPVDETPEPPTVRPGNPLAQRLAELAKRNSELMQADDRAISPLDLVAEDTGEDDIAEAETSDDWEVETASDNVEEFESFAEDVSADSDRDEAEEDAFEEEDDLDDDILFAEDEDFDDDDFATEANLDSGDNEETLDLSEATQDVAASDEDAITEGAGDDLDEDDSPKSSPSADRPLLLTTPQRPISEDISEDTDDDFDLSAELAEIEKEIAARPRNGMTRHGLPRRVEDAMSRIFMQTNQQLDEPEGRRHRDALAQLKAAVAATEAAKQLGDKHRSRDMGETFRDDLGALETEGRKGSEGLPPLKLVKADDDVAAVPEPRITSKPLDVAAQRLREIAATKDASEDGEKSEGFVAFLEKQGVSELGDKLEAAAAYLAFVEGEAEFTRPQLMRLVQSASREEITREDGLRCFGRLLRQSRFAKLNNGRFKVDDNTPFRPRSSRVAQG